ncbi:ATP-binding protein [Acetobacterium paludosum]|uniref:ATP-binding protein n=1 Tax=Acetobacterium paludosum TaxID=52693 RepID=A0A923KVK3_9FIRM|nr:AAA family ATPase [Acetobacterium paludosum]MBC3887088.1 ATP-binding protein [Acetobacterium paludosum]
MKIAICGKGGCGKSTITTLLAKTLAGKNKEVLIIDSDESNYGLHVQLGMESPKGFTGYFGGKEKVMTDMLLSQFSHQFFHQAWTVADIPAGYYTEKNKIKLMVSGKINQANEGCSCAMGTVIGQFIANLQLNKDQVALMDMEAGVEHFGRSIDNGVDMILMVVDPSHESLKLTKKIAGLAASIDKPIYYILNKTTDGNKKVMCESIEKSEKIIAEIGLDQEIMEAGLTGKELFLSETIATDLRRLSSRYFQS